MTYACRIGKSYEYRIRNWFKENRSGWKAERNPLSGASTQITEEMGKHDVRAWNDSLNIFIQIEAKKTSKKDNILAIKKEWLDKIDFNNDEILVYSYQNCKQHFCFMTKEVSEKILESTKENIKISKDIIEAKGEVQFNAKREWFEEKEEIIAISFIGNIYHVYDLGKFIDIREKYVKPKDNKQSFVEQIKTLNTQEELEKFFKENESNLKTRDKRVFFSKLERVELGKDNLFNHDMVKSNQFWLPEEKRFDWNENTIKSIENKIIDWTDKNIDEDSEWSNEIEIEILMKDIRKILGLEEKK
jgi:hypothetical protein